MHERIWEYPITGGPSVLARIVDDPVLEKLGLALLRSLNWNGVAMVEFKYSPDAGYFLMEINPRLWGSLDLSIAAGADFPYLLVEPNRRAIARNLHVRPTSCLWLLPESALFLSAMPSRALDLLRLLLSPSVKKSLCLDDLRPAVRQVREALYWLRTLYRDRRLIHPHGWAQPTFE
jgi:predicted ATP-grasp superfamily ATP-dependent carboligase